MRGGGQIFAGHLCLHKESKPCFLIFSYGKICFTKGDHGPIPLFADFYIGCPRHPFFRAQLLRFLNGAPTHNCQFTGIAPRTPVLVFRTPFPDRSTFSFYRPILPGPLIKHVPKPARLSSVFRSDFGGNLKFRGTDDLHFERIIVVCWV